MVFRVLFDLIFVGAMVFAYNRGFRVIILLINLTHLGSSTFVTRSPKKVFLLQPFWFHDKQIYIYTCKSLNEAQSCHEWKSRLTDDFKMIVKVVCDYIRALLNPPTLEVTYLTTTHSVSKYISVKLKAKLGFRWIRGSVAMSQCTVWGWGPSRHSVQLDPHSKSMYGNWVPYQG